MNFAALLDLEKSPAALPYDARGYDLEGFRDWLADLGNPERGQRFLHIAGTKGKGSTAAMAEAMLLALGFDTATFTSPHLAHFGERFRFNGAAWSPQEFEAAMERLNIASQPPWRDALKTWRRFRTAFEFMTMAALVEFARRGRTLAMQTPPRRQIVCWETGLGGRLDCTNVVDPAVAVITTLGLDHTAILGETIEQIALEKAGIIKPGRPVVVARQSPEFAERVLPVLRRRAEEAGAPLYLAREMCPVVQASERGAGQEIEFGLPDGSRHKSLLPLHGAFQQANLEAALAAVWLLLESEHTPIEADLGERLAQGISHCQWPGRMEVVLSPTGQALVLDGAHCPLSAEAAAGAIAAWQDSPVLPNAGPMEILWGMQRDKDHRAFLSALLRHAPPGLFGSLHSYRVTGVRGAEAELLAQVARESGMTAQAHPSPEAALHAAAQTGRNTLAVGTLYTIAHLRGHWPHCVR
jgi:dihydrofolate synthase / folylpolyglutamate synthase